MQFIIHRLIYLVCFFSCSTILAQTPFIDSLKQELTSTPEDTTRLDQLLLLCQAYNETNPLEGFPFAKEASRLAQELNLIEKEAQAHKLWGRLAANYGHIDTALIHFQKARKLASQFESDKFMLDLMLKFKFIHWVSGNNDSAMYYSFEALRIGERVNDSIGIAGSLSDIADLMATEGNPEEAISYAERALAINKAIGNKSEIAYTYQTMGVIYRELGDLDRALSYQNKSNELFLEIDSQIDYAIGLLYRGNIYKYRKEYGLASTDYHTGIVLAKELGYPGLVDALNGSLGDLYVQTEEYEKALPILLKAVKKMDEQEMSSNLPENYRHISKAYASLQDFDSAYHFLALSYIARDTIFSRESEETTARLLKEYETQKNLDEIALLKKDKERQRLIIGFSIGFLALMGMILFLVGRSNRIRKESNRLLSQTNETLHRQKSEIENQKDVIEEQNNKNELLLKEIHHRVKNNLQTISSLLNLQSAHIQDASVKEAVQAGQHRVKSMALIHQKLYQRENLAGVEMKDYLTTLGESLFDTFGSKAGQIELDIAMDELELDVDTAVPVGLIVNELITNSFKYAFPDGRYGKISVSLIKNATQQLELTVTDNGVGKTDDVPSKDRTSFGSRLIHLLSLQLNGKLHIDHDKGTATHLVF